MEILLKLLEAIPMPLALVLVGYLGLRAFLRLATFSQVSRGRYTTQEEGLLNIRDIITRALTTHISPQAQAQEGLIRIGDINIQSEAWLVEGVKCIILYLLLESGVLPETIGRYPQLLWQIRELPRELQMLALLAWMIGPIIALFVVSLLLPVSYWLSLATDIFARVLRIVFRAARSRSQEEETPSEPEEIVVWKERPHLSFLSLLAFVICLVLWGFLQVKGPLIFFLLAATVSINQAGPSLYIEPAHKSFRRWVVPAVWVYYWATACIGWQYDWAGLFFITVPALLIAGLGLFFVAGTLLPFPEPDLYRGTYPDEPQAEGASPRKRRRGGLLNALRYPRRHRPGTLSSFEQEILYWCGIVYQDIRYWLFALTLRPLTVLHYWLWLILFARECERTKKVKAALDLALQQSDMPKQYLEQHQAWTEYLMQRRLALRALVTYALGTNYPYYVVIDEKITDRVDEEHTWLTGEERIVKRVDGDIFGGFLSGPGIVITGCDHAVVLHAGTKLKGAKGPGVVFTEYADRPTQAIDLRGQLRAFTVEAWTKDGIAVRVLTFVPFQISTGKEQPTLGKGFPYRPSDVFKAVQGQVVEHVDPSQAPENLEKRAWYDLPQVIGERAIRDVISGYNFDDLYKLFELLDSPDQHPRAQVAKALRDKLDEELPKLGLRRIGGGIGNIEPVDLTVIEQRVMSWGAEWRREVIRREAEGLSTRLRLMEQARAKTQTEIILNIGQRIQQLREMEPASRVGTVLEYFVEVLEQLAGRPNIRHLIAQDMDVVLKKLRSAARRTPSARLIGMGDEGIGIGGEEIGEEIIEDRDTEFEGEG